MTLPSVTPLGESAFTLTLADRISPGTRTRIHAITRELREAPPPGVIEVVPAYTTLAVWFDPQVADPGELEAFLLSLADRCRTDGPFRTGRVIEVPVRYDGPDLEAVAGQTGLDVDDVIARHAGRDYEVCFLGFVPGFAFLGDLDPALVLPRRQTPRTRVPAGSVGIAGAQTGIYPLDTPGGWHLIGHTDLSLFDPSREEPALFRIGDLVRFRPTP